MKKPTLSRREMLKTSAAVSLAAANFALAPSCSGGEELAGQGIEIGTRRELFVDDFLIDKLDGATRRLHSPTAREVSLVRNKPWEGNVSGYTTVFQEGDLYRMYYRGADTVYTQGKVTSPHREVCCYAESNDGIHWTRPDLELVEFQGSKKNNIIWDGVGSHAFTPFLDTNPDCPAELKYKAFGYGGPGSARQIANKLFILGSADGIRWKLLSDDPVKIKGAFDSQNLAFWDSLRGEYRAYVRDFRTDRAPRGRDIRTCTSKDFVNWGDAEFLEYSPDRTSELYTNGVIPYYRAPHIFVGFPTRYVDHGWAESTKQLSQRQHRELVASSARRAGTAFTDGMFMSSRDGQRFDIWPESFIRPGIQRPGSWFYGDGYQNWGIVETPSQFEGAPNELSFYVSEAGRQKGGNRLRRYTLRIDGFVSVNAPLAGGSLVTRPLQFSGNRLEINFSTSAAGSIAVEIQDEQGKPMPGFALADCHLQFGDQIDRVVSWKSGTTVNQLASKPIRLKIHLKDADLFSVQFVPKG